MKGFGRLKLLFMCGLAATSPIQAGRSAPLEPTYPGVHWETRAPEAVGLSAARLAELQALVGGRGCVVRQGFMVFTWGDQSKSSDVASAFKPLLTTLLLMAVQEGRLRSVDQPVSDFEPRLIALNDGKDKLMTWRHLAMQTSGYGLVEKPGDAYSYNDYALTLYYDTLTLKVFGTNGTEVLRTRLAEPLAFEDRYTFNAFGPDNRPGRLALSCRDFARFGLLYLRNGGWRGRQLLRPEMVKLTTGSPLAPDFPGTSGWLAPMLPGRRTMGGTRNITPVGPGYYSFNWWLNRTNALGQRLLEDAPGDTILASGHGGMRVLLLLPGRDLVVCWNDSAIEDHDRSPGNVSTKMNRATKLIRGALRD
jgi:CubicO group peptidase (beta-lactamase class C family)